MPWITPSLRQTREMVRDDISAALTGAALVGNSVLRVMADAKAGLAHLTLRYIDWLSRQFLPDTAETEWLDRHGDIWLVNADGTVGRKSATYAEGSVTFTGLEGLVVPIGMQLVGANGVLFETTVEATLGSQETEIPVRAIDAGVEGNFDAGISMQVVAPMANMDGTVTVVSLTGGADEEDDDDLRLRVLERIRNPPMGGSLEDYVNWTLRVSGVTRAWAAQEMGIGTITVRFMMDDLRSTNDGFPTPTDIQAVKNYLDTVRPVAVKDYFVQAPLKQRIDFHLTTLNPDTTAVRAAIEESIKEMLDERAAPGQTIYAAWKYDAISRATGVRSFNLTTTDDVMLSAGHMAHFGDIFYVGV